MKLPLWLIAAVARNGVIGRDNDLPWRFPADLRWFKEKTMHHPIIMGRRNWESFRGRVLPGRPHLVISRSPKPANVPQEVRWFSDLETAIATARVLDAKQPPFIIGGGEVYRQALPLVTRMYLTEIPLEAEGNIHFPEWNQAEWKEDGCWNGPEGLIWRAWARVNRVAESS
jgi:dihydrofolate reductase